MGFIEIGVILFLSVLFFLARLNSVKATEQLKNLDKSYLAKQNK